MADWLFPVAPNEGLRFVNIGKFCLGLKNIGPKQGEKKKFAIFWLLQWENTMVVFFI